MESPVSLVWEDSEREEVLFEDGDVRSESDAEIVVAETTSESDAAEGLLFDVMPPEQMDMDTGLTFEVSEPEDLPVESSWSPGANCGTFISSCVPLGQQAQTLVVNTAANVKKLPLKMVKNILQLLPGQTAGQGKSYSEVLAGRLLGLSRQTVFLGL